MSKQIEIQLGPPPKLRRKIALEASQISDPAKENSDDVSQREGDVGENGKISPLQPLSPQVSDATADPQRAPAAAKNPESPKQRVGRKPDPTSSLPRVFDSITQCSAVTGIPVSALRESKKAGCAAFRHSRVDLVEFLRWRFGQAEDAVSDWGDQLKQYKARREKIALDKDLGLVADRSIVTFTIGKAMSVLFSTMDRSFGNTLPPALKGLSESEIQQRLLVAAESFKQAVRAELQNFVNKTESPSTEIKK